MKTFVVLLLAVLASAIAAALLHYPTIANGLMVIACLAAIEASSVLSIVWISLKCLHPADKKPYIERRVRLGWYACNAFVALAAIAAADGGIAFEPIVIVGGLAIVLSNVLVLVSIKSK